MEQGQVARADKFHGAIRRRAAHDESRKLSSKRALAENSVGILHHAFERKARFGEAAKRCVQMAHQH